MNEKQKNIITGICSALEAYLIYLAQGVAVSNPEKYPSPFNHGILQNVYPHISGLLGDIAIIFILCIIGMQCLFYVLTDNDYRQWICKLFQHIIDQNLGGQTYETRITLYVESRGWRFLWKSFCFSICRMFSERTFKYFRGIPNPIKKILIPYARFSYPEKESTYTTYHAIAKEQVASEGAVEQCYKTGKSVYIQAPYINDIILPSSMSGLNTSEAKRVKDYMKKTGIGYNKLRLLQRKANVLYAIPLRRGAHIWGVLIFDNNSEANPLDLQDKLKDVIDNYQKIIQLTINNI